MSVITKEQKARLAAQKNEFDALGALCRAYEALPPVDDDDYVEARYAYESRLRAFLEALRENGRLDPPPLDLGVQLARHNKFLWNVHTAIVEKTIVPGTEEDARFLALALAGEVGEVANIIKKAWRGDFHTFDVAKVGELAEELGDVLAYLLLLAACFKVDLERVMTEKIVPKVSRRWPAGAARAGTAR